MDNRRIDNTINKRTWIKGQNIIYKTLHRKLNDWTTRTTLRTRVNTDTSHKSFCINNGSQSSVLRVVFCEPLFILSFFFDHLHFLIIPLLSLKSSWFIVVKRAVFNITAILTTLFEDFQCDRYTVVVNVIWSYFPFTAFLPNKRLTQNLIPGLFKPAK